MQIIMLMNKILKANALNIWCFLNSKINADYHANE